MSVITRLPPPYGFGWPGKSYDPDARRKEFEAQFAIAAARSGISLEPVQKPLESAGGLEELLRGLSQEKPDAVLVCIQEMSVWPWVEKISRLGRPLIIFAPIGTAFTRNVDQISRRPGVSLISSLEASEVEQVFRMVRAKRCFEETRLLVVGRGDPDPNQTFRQKVNSFVASVGRFMVGMPDMTSETMLGDLGTKLKFVPASSLYGLFIGMPETEEVRQIARMMSKGAERVIEPSQKDLLNAARAFTAAKHLLKEENCNAMTTNCLGMVLAKRVPTPPCMAASLFQDAGVTYGCEADIFGAVSLMLPSYLFDRPGFINDPVPETVKNELIAAHCTSGTRLNGFKGEREPYILRSHHESDIGVSMQVLWRQGQPVTLVRFETPKRIILDTGTVVGNSNTPPAGSCRTSVEIMMDNVEDVRDVRGFHQVVFYGNHRRSIEAFCQMYDIEVVHSPERRVSCKSRQ
jgi:hypothetical protein